MIRTKERRRREQVLDEAVYSFCRLQWSRQVYPISNKRLVSKYASGEKTMQEYQDHKQEWENRAFENEDENNMPGLDIDEY